MDKHLVVQCECLGTGYIATVDRYGEDTEYIDCYKHHEDYREAPTVNELLTHLGSVTGVNI